ncbi:MAG: biotin transporter BioY [Candidatus Omnitrophota bacterium]
MMEAIFKREVVVNKTISRIIGVMAFVVLTSLGAFVRIPLPFTPVPLTLQTFFVLLSGLCLGSLGAVSQVIYVLLGITGIPIFSTAASGLYYLSGPTAGYIFGFILAALFLGKFTKESKGNLFYLFVILCLADSIILACGTLWLKVILRITFKKSLLIGFVPFILGDLLKISVAASLFVRLKTRLQEIFS